MDCPKTHAIGGDTAAPRQNRGSGGRTGLVGKDHLQCKLMTQPPAAAARQQCHDGRGCLFNRAAGHVDDRQLCLAQRRRENAISSATAWPVDNKIHRAMRVQPSSRFWRICTMRSGLANKPTTSGT